MDSGLFVQCLVIVSQKQLLLVAVTLFLANCQTLSVSANMDSSSIGNVFQKCVSFPDLGSN